MNSDDRRKRVHRQDSICEDCSSSKRRSPDPLDEGEITATENESAIREGRRGEGSSGTENESVKGVSSSGSEKDAATDGKKGVDNSSSSVSKVAEIKSEMNVLISKGGDSKDDGDDSSSITEINIPPEEPEKKISNAEVLEGKVEPRRPEGDIFDRKVLFLIGPPCAGKTTLCDLLREKFENSYRVISARSVIQKLANEGKSGAVDALTKGVMFDPTTVTKEIGKEILSEDSSDARPVIIDGFPRVKENLTAWTEFVEGENGIRYCGTIVLNQDPEECEKRAALRAREDDHTIKARLTRWQEETRPLLLNEIDGARFIRNSAEFRKMADELLYP